MGSDDGEPEFSGLDSSPGWGVGSDGGDPKFSGPVLGG